jgi:D-alanyl-D-alanine dipeptidase
MSEPLSIGDPGLGRVRLFDHGEALVDLSGVDVLRLDHRLAGESRGYGRLRASVVDRLVVAQSLLPRDVRLLVVEGHRTQARQRAHYAVTRSKIRQSHPEWTDDQVDAETARYCVPSETAPHLTGAAADLSLCTTAGAELAMGGLVHAGPTDCGGSCAMDPPNLSGDARANRAVLAKAMSGAGFVNLPTAWWHWSFGDRYWCHVTGSTHAAYGPVEVTP